MANKNPLPSASLYSLLQELSSRLPAQVQLDESAGSLQRLTNELDGFVQKLGTLGDSNHRTLAEASKAKKLAGVIVDQIRAALQVNEKIARRQVWVGAYENRHTDPVLLTLGQFVDDIQRYIRIGLPLFVGGKLAVSGKRAEILPQIEEIVPDQVIAAARFEFVQDVLYVRHDPADPEEDAEIANSALSALLAAGERILERLKDSNCDPRLAETVELVHQALLSREDIVALGIRNIEYRAIREEFEEELPKAINAVLKAHTYGIDSYLGQFADWRKYSENAASVNLASDDIDNLHSVVGTLINSLSSHHKAVAKEVPEAIQFLNRVMKEPKVASKQVAFALIRTIQNLASKVFHYGAAFLDDLITKTSQGSASALSKIAIIGLVGLVVDTAFGLSPIAGKIAEAGWMKEAAELIKVQLELLTK